MRTTEIATNPPIDRAIRDKISPSVFIERSSTEIAIAQIATELKELGNEEEMIFRLLQRLSTAPPGVKAKLFASARPASLEGKSALATLQKFVGDSRIAEAIRVEAVTLFRYMGVPATELLCRALSTDESVSVRKSAAKGLREISRRAPTPNKYTASLIKALSGILAHEKDQSTRKILKQTVDAITSSVAVLTAERRMRDDLRLVRAKSLIEEYEAPTTTKSVAPKDNYRYADDPVNKSALHGILLLKPPSRPVKVWRPDLRRIARLKAIIDQAPPEDYDVLYAELQEFNALMKEEMAARLTRAFNQRLQSMPCESYRDKQEAASWVNSQLRQLGLSIRCPQTGRPAILIADTRSGGSNISRFRLDITDANGHRKRIGSSQTPPDLVLMGDAVRSEPLASWTAKIRAKNQGKLSK